MILNPVKLTITHSQPHFFSSLVYNFPIHGVEKVNLRRLFHISLLGQESMSLSQLNWLPLVIGSTTQRGKKMIQFEGQTGNRRNQFNIKLGERTTKTTKKTNQSCFMWTKWLWYSVSVCVCCSINQYKWRKIKLSVVLKEKKSWQALYIQQGLWNWRSDEIEAVLGNRTELPKLASSRHVNIWAQQPHPEAAWSAW